MSTASCFLKVPKHELKVPATGGEPVAWRRASLSHCKHSDHAAHNGELAGRGEQQAARRDEQPRGLLRGACAAPCRCHRASASSSALCHLRGAMSVLPQIEHSPQR